jgi:hypothetical protein
MGLKSESKKHRFSLRLSDLVSSTKVSPLLVALLGLLVLAPSSGVASVAKGRHQQLRIMKALWRCKACGGSGWCIYRGVGPNDEICGTCGRGWEAHNVGKNCLRCKGTGGWR